MPAIFYCEDEEIKDIICVSIHVGREIKMPTEISLAFFRSPMIPGWRNEENPI